MFYFIRVYTWPAPGAVSGSKICIWMQDLHLDPGTVSGFIICIRIRSILQLILGRPEMRKFLFPEARILHFGSLQLLTKLCIQSLLNNVVDPVHFFGSGSVDPVLKTRIWVDQRDRIRIQILMLNNLLWHFLTKSKHLLTLKIKDKK